MNRALVPLFLACAAILTAATPEEAIKQADRQWAAAVKARDVAALDKIFTPGLVYAHASGKIEDKTEYLNRLKSGKQRYDDVRIESTKVIPYGDSVITHSIVRTIGVNDSGKFNDHVMMMHVWVKQGGKWLLAAHQTTKVP